MYFRNDNHVFYIFAGVSYTASTQIVSLRIMNTQEQNVCFMNGAA